MRLAYLIRYSCLCFILGIILGSVVLDTWWSIPLSVIAFLFACVLLWIVAVTCRFKWIIMVAVCALGFAAVLWHHVAYTPHDIPSDIRTFSGEVLFVETYLNKQRLVVQTTCAGLCNLRIFLYTSRYPRYRAGDLIAFSCQLKQILPYEDFPFDRYAERLRVQASCYDTSVTVTGISQGIRRTMFRVKDWYSDTFLRTFHEPMSSFLQALVLRQTREVPQTIRDSFSAAGTAHILSISGLHMGILIFMLSELLIIAGIPQVGRWWILALCSFLYVSLLGFPASAVRAVFMSLSILASNVVGRPTNGMHILIVTAAVMAAMNPFIIMFDIGFQLSFAALAGIVLTVHLFKQLLWFIPSILGLRALVSVTLAAQTFTWPLVAYYFDLVSFISPFSNVIVVPLMTAVLGGALLIPLVSVVPLLSALIAWPVFFISQFILDITVASASLPWSHVNVHFSPFLLVLSYVSLGICYVLVLRWLRRSRNVPNVLW